MSITAEQSLGYQQSGAAALPKGDQEIASLINLAHQKGLGADVEAEIGRYFSTSASLAYKETSNAGSSDCWINAAENHYLRHDRSKLIQFFSQLIRSGEMTRNDFTTPDEQADTQLGSRTGASLAFDRACKRFMQSPQGATAFTIEQFETRLAGKRVVSVYNNENDPVAIKTLLEHPELAAGVRAGLRWLPNSQHALHIVNIDRVDLKEGRVYFYQAVSIPGINGPRRRWEGHDGLESMTVEEFSRATMGFWVQDSTASKLNLQQSYDPQYFRPGNTPAPGSAQFITGLGSFYPLDFVTADLLKPQGGGMIGGFENYFSAPAVRSRQIASELRASGAVEYRYRNLLEEKK